MRKIQAQINLAALSELFAHLGKPAILGGNCASGQAEGFSYWMYKPVETFEFRSGQHHPFEKLRQILGKYRLENAADGFPKRIFCGGWVGYFGYELGRYIEKLDSPPEDDLKLPLIRLCFYDRVICYDHAENSFWLIALEFQGQAEGPEEKLAAMEQLLSEAGKIQAKAASVGGLNNIDISQIQCNQTQDYYLETIAKIKRLIFDGEVYQVNFSQRFESNFTGRAIELFHWQNRHNACAYAAYIDAGDFQIVSASPEMFISISDGFLRTKPIKGTRPRVAENDGQATAINNRNFQELACSEKEQAELNMIIDLERNDLTRICEYGTIKVVQPRTIETYPTVFHAVATVAGRLRRGICFCEVLKAVFPGGSITGAPKIAAMQIIEQLEPTARGVYTGGIGFIGVDGTVNLNIAIRTVIIKGGKAYVQAGGGIVADSRPQEELAEVNAKAAALLKGIQAVNGLFRGKISCNPAKASILD